MRTILSLFVAALAVAQTPTEIERLEKAVSDHPDNVGDRARLVTLLTNPTVPSGQVLELRRQHILWLIEHHPEAKIYDSPPMLLPARGRLADPEGSTRAVQLWGEIVAKSGVKPEIIANAAIYLRSFDPQFALTLLDGRPDNPFFSRARGAIMGSIFLGILPEFEWPAGMNYGSSAALRSSPDAKKARDEIESSTDGFLVGAAALVLTDRRIALPNDLAFGDEDVFSLGERWLRHAIELAPPGTEWKLALGRILRTEAGRVLDPREKVRILEDAQSLVSDQEKPDTLRTLIIAEFDAGDDNAAETDAQQLLATAPKNAAAYNTAQTILGRLAAARGDLSEAKKRLMASIASEEMKKSNFQPDLMLAQDIYDAGDQSAVIEFLEASRIVWKGDLGRIDRMISFVKKAPSADLTQLARQFPGNEMLRKPAPSFTAVDLDGKTWTREQLAGKLVALEFGNDPLVEKVAKDFVSRGGAFVRTQDSDTKRRFEVLTEPTLVVIDRQGNISGYRSGATRDVEWRGQLEAVFGRNVLDTSLPPPQQSETMDAAHRKALLSWEAVYNAESYVVEWDFRDDKGWIFDRDRTVRVFPTRDLSTTLDLTGYTRIRWRVYAVPLRGPAGKLSPWLEIEGIPVTQNYK